MSSIPATPRRDALAHLRFSIIGLLLAAPPEPGQLYPALRALAAKTWRHPLTGKDIRFAAATIERWYYAARYASDPVNRLRDRRRGDRGTFHSLVPQVITVLRAQYEAHPGWSMQLHFDNLRAALHDTALPSYPTIRRYLRAHGMLRRARPARASEGALAARDRLEQREIRSYEVNRSYRNSGERSNPHGHASVGHSSR